MTNPPPRLILTIMLSLRCLVSPTSTFDSWYIAHSNHAIEHKEHPHCPSSLHCLRDTDGRPPHTLPVILRCTILGSPNKKLTIREIYAAMENKYPWYKTAGNAWKVRDLWQRPTILIMRAYSLFTLPLLAICPTSPFTEPPLRTRAPACHRPWGWVLLDREP